MKRWQALARSVGFPGTSPVRWVAFVLLAVSLFLLTGVIVFASRDGQQPGNLAQSLVAGIYRALGLSGTIFGFLLVIIWAARIFLSGQVPRLGVKAIGVAGVVVSVCGLSGTVAYVSGGSVEVGTLGHAIAEGLVPLFSRGACVVVFTAMLVGSLLLATNWFFLEEFKALASHQALTLRKDREASLGEEEPEEVTPREERAIILPPPPRAESTPLQEEEVPWQEEAPLWEEGSDRGGLEADEEEEPAASEETEAPAGLEGAGEVAEEASVEEPAGEAPDLDLEEEPVRGQRLLWQERAAEEVEKEVPAVEPVKFDAGLPGDAPPAPEEPAVVIPRPEREVPAPMLEDAPAARHESGFHPIDPALLDQAAPLIIQSGRASITMLQRKLQIRFAQASQLMEALEQAGVVGPYRGSLPREIRMTMEQWLRLGVGDRP